MFLVGVFNLSQQKREDESSPHNHLLDVENGHGMIGQGSKKSSGDAWTVVTCQGDENGSAGGHSRHASQGRSRPRLGWPLCHL